MTPYAIWPKPPDYRRPLERRPHGRWKARQRRRVSHHRRQAAHLQRLGGRLRAWPETIHSQVPHVYACMPSCRRRKSKTAQDIERHPEHLNSCSYSKPNASAPLDKPAAVHMKCCPRHASLYATPSFSTISCISEPPKNAIRSSSSSGMTMLL